MLRLNFSILLILIFCAVSLHIIGVVYKTSLPMINLPEVAHHTIGEVPFIQEVDIELAEPIKFINSGFVICSGMVVQYGDY